MDPIADMLIRLKNASKVGNELTEMPFSNIKNEIARVLQARGFIKSFSTKGKKVVRKIEVELAYHKDKSPRIEDARRISKPSRRVYVGAKEIKPVRHGAGIVVLSTPKGIMTGDEAKKAGVGGEILFTMW